MNDEFIFYFFFSRPHLQGANTVEIDQETKHPLVIDMPEFHPGFMGGSMRLGKRTTVFKDTCNSTISKFIVRNFVQVD